MSTAIHRMSKGKTMKERLEALAIAYRDRYHTSWKVAVLAIVASFPSEAQASGFGAWLSNPRNRT
jgi:hypothetical protein